MPFTKYSTPWPASRWRNSMPPHIYGRSSLLNSIHIRAWPNVSFYQPIATARWMHDQPFVHVCRVRAKSAGIISVRRQVHMYMYISIILATITIGEPEHQLIHIATEGLMIIHPYGLPQLVEPLKLDIGSCIYGFALHCRFLIRPCPCFIVLMSSSPLNSYNAQTENRNSSVLLKTLANSTRLAYSQIDELPNVDVSRL